MDVYCEVCGIVTTVPSDALGGAALECSVCGGATLHAHKGDTATLPAGGVGQRSSRPPPPLRRSSAPTVPRDDDDPTMMDLRSLALKSFLSTLPAATTSSGAVASSVAPGSGPVAPAAGLAAPQGSRVAASTPSTPSTVIAGTTPVAVDALSVSDVLRVYDALVPVAAPSRARQRARVRAFVAASVVGALAIGIGLTLIAGWRSRAPADEVLPAAQRGVSRAGEIARAVSAPVEAPALRRNAPRGPEASAPAAGEDDASAAEPSAALQSRAAPEAGAREASGAGLRALAAAGARAAAASGTRARPERLPSPPPASDEAPRPQPPVSLTDAMAAAVADTPAPAAAETQRQADTTEE
ncbi:hypothetical protein [Sorangium sp. So ce1000]|uniref:hypothetical protein n=1 Tax=Sorangium sp. So ce1000 TaxID=3133325 RepID=UPI003F608B6C